MGHTWVIMNGVVHALIRLANQCFHYFSSETLAKLWSFKIFNSYHAELGYTLKPVLSGHSKRRPKLVFKTNYRIMQVKSNADCFIKLPFAIKTFVLSCFE